MNIVIKKSHNQNKKFMALIDDKKTIHFGAKHEDYTHHKDDKRKKAYLARHKHDNAQNPYAGFYATNLLWHKPTLKESIQSTNNKFKNLNIKLKYT